MSKYAKLSLLRVYSEILKYARSYFVKFSKNMKYTIVFVLTNTSKYAYVPYHHIFTKIRSYLVHNE